MASSGVLASSTNPCRGHRFSSTRDSSHVASILAATLSVPMLTPDGSLFWLVLPTPRCGGSSAPLISSPQSGPQRPLVVWLACLACDGLVSGPHRQHQLNATGPDKLQGCSPDVELVPENVHLFSLGSTRLLHTILARAGYRSGLFAPSATA